MSSTYCRKHRVHHTADAGCYQCAMGGHGRLVMIKVSAYGNGASGENKVKEGQAKEAKKGQ